jgi:hypothetical protein
VSLTQHRRAAFKSITATPCKLGQVPKTFSSANISFGSRKLLLLFSQLTLSEYLPNNKYCSLVVRFELSIIRDGAQLILNMVSTPDFMWVGRKMERALLRHISG